MAKNTESEMSNLHPLRVLMVEDSEDDALLVLRELKKGGYNPEYERVETAAAMRKALQDKTWDVILCDYQLPSFNGIEAIAVLKEINIDIPIIMVSGSFSALGIPPEVLSVALIKPLSGSASTAIFTDIVRTTGPDSLASRISAVIIGSAETTFFVLAVYLGAVNIRRTKYLVPVCLIADGVGIIIAIAVVKLMF